MGREGEPGLGQDDDDEADRHKQARGTLSQPWNEPGSALQESMSLSCVLVSFVLTTAYIISDEHRRKAVNKTDKTIWMKGKLWQIISAVTSPGLLRTVTLQVLCNRRHYWIGAGGCRHPPVPAEGRRGRSLGCRNRTLSTQPLDIHTEFLQCFVLSLGSVWQT